MENPEQALRRAINAYGTQHKMAKQLGYRSQGIVNYWLSTGRIPPEVALKVEKTTGVHRGLLRPDIWPMTDAQKAALDPFNIDGIDLGLTPENDTENESDDTP